MPYTLGIAELSQTYCKLRRALYIISRKNKIFLKSKISYKGKIGSIIHFVIQQLLKNYISHIEYYYFREKKSLYESIETVIRDILEYTYFLLELKNKSNLLKNTELIDIETETDIHIPIIVKTIEQLIILDEEGKLIHTNVVDDEFTIAYEIFDDILMIGKIDLVCYDYITNKLEFYEIKTGSLSKIADPRRQLKLYKEIFLKSRLRNEKLNVTLHLWSTMPGDKAKGYGIISDVKIRKPPEIQKTKDFINEYKDKYEEYSLPPPLIRHFSDNICKYCDYCKNMKIILNSNKKKQPSISEFFKQ